MKLSSLKTVEVYVKGPGSGREAVELISGGLAVEASKKKDITSDTNDCYSDDK